MNASDPDLEVTEPPQDVGAEEATLGAILLSDDTARTLLPLLRAGQFYRPEYGELLGVMKDMHTAGEPIDPLTVHAELRRRGRLCFGERSAALVLHDLLAATPVAGNGRYYAGLVAEAAARRRVVEAGTRLVQLGGSGVGQLDQLMSDAVRELACIRAAVERHVAIAGLSREESPPIERPLRAVGESDLGR